MSEIDLQDVPEFFREKVEKLFEVNRQYSQKYLEQLLQLEEYKRKHPTKIVIFKCMDGRIVFSRYTQTPLGLLTTFRNLGGQFNFGWKALKETFKDVIHKSHREHVERMIRYTQMKTVECKDRLQLLSNSILTRAEDATNEVEKSCYLCNEGNACLVIVTYHFSEGDNAHRGCAGSNYDIDKSVRDAKGFRMDIHKAHEDSSHVVFPIVVGIGTDEDVLILHGEDGQVRNLGDLPEKVSKKELLMLINELYPSMPIRMRIDFLPLLRGNIKHIANVRKTHRPIEEMTHGEYVLGMCDSEAVMSLHEPNMAILVGLFNPELPKIFREGLRVISPNAKNGFLFLTAACYGGDEPKSAARREAKYYSRLGIEQIKTYYNELSHLVYPVRVLVNRETQLFELITDKDK